MIEPFDDLFFSGFFDSLFNALIINADCELYDVFHFYLLLWVFKPFYIFPMLHKSNCQLVTDSVAELLIDDFHIFRRKIRFQKCVDSSKHKLVEFAVSPFLRVWL